MWLFRLEKPRQNDKKIANFVKKIAKICGVEILKNNSLHLETKFIFS